MLLVSWWVVLLVGLLFLLCALWLLGAEAENRSLRRSVRYWESRYWDEIDAVSGEPLEWPPRRWN